MIQFYFIIIFSIILSACVSAPTFKKTSYGVEGYSVQNLATQDHFQVIIKLPEGTNSKYFINYGYRAVGEECLVRGFEYFDVGELDKTVFEGFCFQNSTRKALAINFQNNGLIQSPARFVVEHLNNKTATQLMPNDEILLIEEKAPNSMANLKSLVFVATTNNKSVIPIKIKRQGREIKVIEPIADLKNGVFDKNDLKSLRFLVR